MREAAFVKANKDKWVEFESVLKNKKHISPDKLADLYLEVSDHLSYARTFYPNSNTALYLNQLASRSHQLIYKTKNTPGSRWKEFYVREFPLMFYKYRGVLAVACFTFAIFTAIGAFSAATDAAFVRVILGDEYVNQTLDNIAKGDPMGIYKGTGEISLFLGVTINNIKVAVTAFALGLFLGLGTLYVLMKNGVMLGSFQYFFADKGLFWESFRTIWIHGTIEISVIIIAGTAGLVVGNAVLFPGTYSRLESFKRGMADGSKIMLSTLPFFVIAGFLEGFVTRHTEMPDWLAYGIILVSLVLILFYYVFYPKYLNLNINHGKSTNLTSERKVSG